MRSVESRIARTLSAVALLSLPGCRQALDIPDDPKLVEPVEEGPWTCLGHPPPKKKSEADAALVRIKACNFVSPKCSEPVTNFTAKLCSKLDLKCTNPLQDSI